jgi:DNA-binding response OmpR family regulator
MEKSLILLVDDEIPYATVIKEALAPYGIEVLIAANASQALYYMQKYSPQVVLLDVMMPELDGLSLLRWLRDHSEQEDIPIHIVSAKALPNDKKAAMDAGADGFLAKPFTLDELRELLKPHLPQVTIELEI